ncbi:MAG: hypothetical protein JW889_09250 [Verrucomicrobia bacterium]|nr:hypothetical protein [Verrucomicrobiota bacterium]
MRTLTILVVSFLFVLVEVGPAAQWGEGIPEAPSPPAFKRTKEYLLGVPPDLTDAGAAEGDKKPKAEAFTPAFIYKRDGDIWGRLEDGTKPTNLTNFAEDADYKAKLDKAIEEEKAWRKATGGRSGRTPILLDFTVCREDGKVYYYVGYVQRDFEFFSLNVDGSGKTPVAKLSLPALGANESADDEFLHKRRNVVFAFRTGNPKLAPLRVETMGIEHLRDYALSPDAKRFARLWRQLLRADMQADDASRRVNDGKGHYLIVDSVRGNAIHGYPLLDVDKANEDLPPGGIAIQVPEDPSTGSTSNTNYMSWGLYWSPDGAWIAMLGPQERQGWGGGIEPSGHIVLLKADASDARVYHRWAPDKTWVSTMQERSRPVRVARTPNGTRHRDEMEGLTVQYVCPAANENWQQIGNPLGTLTWSPDSKYISCWVRRQVENAWVVNFAIMRVADGRFVRVDCAPGLGNDYAWSPDGKRIAIEVTGKQRPNRPLTPQDIEEMVSALCVAEVEALFKDASSDVTAISPDDERFTKIAVGYKGVGLTWVGPAMEEGFVPLELVVPQGSELTGELAGIRQRHDAEVDKLKKLSEKLKAEADNEELLDEIREVRMTIRIHEADFFETVGDAMGAYGWADFDAQSQAFHDRVTYLQRQVVTWHDTLREYGYASYVMHFSQYRREEQRFKQALVDLNHTLDLWNVYNGMAQAHHELIAREIRIQLGTAGRTAELEAFLAPICRRKAGLLLDQGERALIQAQANREAALYYQRSYWDGIRAEAEKRKDVETLTAGEEAMAMTAFGSQFLLRTIGGAWEAWLDTLKWAPDQVPVIGEFFESRAEKVDRQVLEMRKETAAKVKALDEMRGYDDVEYGLLRDALRALAFDEDGSPKGTLPADISLGQKALTVLLTDRYFHEQTDGGLFRIAGAFDAALTDKLSTEYLAAQHQGRLVVYDIQAALRARMGVDVKTGETSWAIILEPTKNIETIVRGYSGEWATRGDFVGRRKGHVSQMLQMAPFWRTRNYAFQAYEQLPGTDAPPGEEPKAINYEIHEALAKSSPEYVNFLVRRVMLIHDAEAVEFAIANARRDVPGDWERLEDYVQQRRLIMRAQVQVMRARALRLEAADRLMAWDYDGCIARLKEAFCIDPSLQTPAEKDPKRPDLAKEILARRQKLSKDIEELEAAFRYEKTLGTQIASLREAGQQGFMTALIGGACQGIKFPGSLAETGGQIWQFSASVFKFTGKSAWAKFGQYAVQEINPFFICDVRGVLSIFRTSAQMVVAEAGSEMALRSLESFDVDTDWLRPLVDRLAIVLVARGAHRVEEAYAASLEQLCGDLARRIKRLHTEHAEAQKKGRVDAETHDKLQAARERLLSWARVLKLIDDIYYEAKGLESEYRLMQADAAVRRGLFRSREEFLYARTRTLTGFMIDRAYSRYKVAEFEAQRLKGQAFDPDAAVELFRRMPIGELRTFRANRDYFTRHPEMEQAIDSVRCALADHGRRHVASKYKDHCRYIVVSGTPPESREYRQLESDSDYTILLEFRPDTSPEARLKLQAEVEAEYIEFFKTRFNGFEAKRYLDSELFCDTMPSKEAVRDINQYLAEFRRGLKNPERYILPDSLAFIPLYLYRKVGVLQEVQPDGTLRTLKGAEAEAVFADVTLHESMGAQIILDQYRFNMKYYAKLWPSIGREAAEPGAYIAKQAKYNLRALLGYNITNEAGLLRHNEFRPTEDSTLHRSIVEIAKQVWPNDTDLHMLAEEWFALKTGDDWRTVLERRRQLHGLPDLQSAVDEHLRVGEEYIGKFLKRALQVQRPHMVQAHKAWWDMANARDHPQRMADEPEYVKQFRQAEYDYWSHVCSQGYLVYRYGLEPGAVEKIVQIEPSVEGYFTPEDTNAARLAHEAADKERRDEDTERLRRIWGD